MRGEKETGVCLMRMDEGMDTGPVHACRTIAICPDETAGELVLRPGELAAEVVREDLAPTLAGERPALAQDHAAATMAPLLKKEDGLVSWSRTAREVHDHVHGMVPWPGAFSTLEGKTFGCSRPASSPTGDPG